MERLRLHLEGFKIGFLGRILNYNESHILVILKRTRLYYIVVAIDRMKSNISLSRNKNPQGGI